MINNDDNDNAIKMMKYNYDDDTNNIILPTAGRLHDPQHEKGQEWCKRLAPPRFYILLFLLLSSTLLLLPGGQIVVCGGHGVDARTSCESWRPGQEEWTQFAQMQ